ncbi:MAG: hypothetical protein AAF938_20450 [Myxococcota bacterium]
MPTPTVPYHARLSVVLLALACGGSSSPNARPTQAAASVSSPLAHLRPDGSEPHLARLTAEPQHADAYADAAVFYGGSRIGGMTLLWGLTHAALSDGQPVRPDVALAMARVLQERVSVQEVGEGRREVSTSLAPGAMPVLAQSNGTMLAPVAHILEAQIAMCFATLRTPWTLGQAVSALRCFATSDGGPFPHAAGAMRPWLGAVEGAGHLDALLHVAFGAGFPDDFAAYAREYQLEIAAMQAWVRANPIQPVEATLPDTLLRVR